MKSKIQLKFSKAYRAARLTTSNSSMPDYYEMEDRPDDILFSAWYCLDHEVSFAIEAKIRTLPERYQMSMGEGPDSGKHGVPAKHAVKVLDCLSALATEYADFLYIEKNEFIALLGNLVERGHLTPEKADHYRETTPVVYTIKDMEGDARNKQDADLALKLAQLYKEAGDTRAQLDWFKQAKRFNSAHLFFAVADNLKASLDGIEAADIAFLFEQEDSADWLLDQLAASPTLKRLSSFDSNFHPKCINKTFADFIKKSQHISELDLGVAFSAYARMTPIHARILAEALQENCSVERLILGEQNIGDKGLKAIIDALINNPGTRLNNLNVFSCCISERGARYLLENIEKIPSLRTVNLSDNDRKATTIISTIDAVLKARMLMERAAGDPPSDTSSSSHVMNIGPRESAFVAELTAYKQRRSADTRGEYYSSFARFFSGEKRSKTAKLNTVDTLIYRIQEGIFDAEKLPAAAKNGELSDIVGRYRASQNKSADLDNAP